LHGALDGAKLLREGADLVLVTLLQARLALQEAALDRRETQL
jgi:hypothetical protein